MKMASWMMIVLLTEKAHCASCRPVTRIMSRRFDNYPDMEKSFNNITVNGIAVRPKSAVRLSRRTGTVICAAHRFRDHSRPPQQLLSIPDFLSAIGSLCPSGA